MKIAIPLIALTTGFLLGHGTEFGPDLFVLMGAIAFTHVSFFAFQVRDLIPHHHETRRVAPAATPGRLNDHHRQAA